MSILAGIASVNPDQRFLRDIQKLFDNSEYQIEPLWVRGKTLVDAQNDISDYFRSSSHSWLLLLEEDHWGHTEDMLDSLLSMPGDVNAISYFSRWPAYPRTAMIKSGKPFPADYRSSGHQGIAEVDLVGFGMTLINRCVIEAMDKPTFQLNQFLSGTRNIATDKNFCERVKALGFKIYADNSHDLIHAGIGKKNILTLVEEWISKRQRIPHGPSVQRRTRHILSQS